MIKLLSPIRYFHDNRKDFVDFERFRSISRNLKKFQTILSDPEQFRKFRKSQKVPRIAKGSEQKQTKFRLVIYPALYEMAVMLCYVVNHNITIYKP